MGKTRTKPHTLKKKAMLVALEKSLGVVTQACKLADIPRRTYYDWLDNDSEFKKDVEEMSEVALDFAESSLLRQIQGEVPASTIFFLKTKGKKRGYIERSEILTNDFPPIEFIDHATDSEDESTSGKPSK